MSWNSKVVWSEGLFLRPHHLQQSDRYLEHLLESARAAGHAVSVGVLALEIDRDLAQQSKFGLRRAAGVMPDGTPFDIPADSPLPPPDRRAGRRRQADRCGCPCRSAAANTREVDDGAAESASRYASGPEMLIDSTSALRIEEEIDIAHPRLGFELRKTAKPGYSGLAIARIVEVRDKAIVFDEKFAPPVLTCAAHPVVEGWIDRVIGWVENKLEELARYAADPTAGGGLQSADYFVLQLLNRHIPVLKHFRRSRYVHPGAALRGAAAPRRRARHLRLAGAAGARIPGLRPRRSGEHFRAGRARHAGFPERPARPARASAWRSSSGRRTRSSRRSATARCSATRRSCWKSRRGGR